MKNKTTVLASTIITLKEAQEKLSHVETLTDEELAQVYYTISKYQEFLSSQNSKVEAMVASRQLSGAVAYRFADKQGNYTNVTFANKAKKETTIDKGALISLYNSANANAPITQYCSNQPTIDRTKLVSAFEQGILDPTLSQYVKVNITNSNVITLKNVKVK